MEHVPVLLTESIDALVHDVDGIYVDCTFGRGGHSAKIMEQLSNKGRLMVIDKDPDAIAVAHQLYDADARVSIAHGGFADISNLLAANEIGCVDGILLDLGVSSVQLDSPERGFSFQKDGPLDMRMDNSQGESAATWLHAATAAEITTVLKTLGEERFARKIALEIVRQRAVKPIQTTLELAALVASTVPRREHKKHPATRTFQAIRIHVNEELEELQTCLKQVFERLHKQGRLVVISFHSLEDRIIKRFIRDLEKNDPYPSRMPITSDQIIKPVKSLGKCVAKQAEVMVNPRARSAVMRVMEKIV
ncbi:MAG: 16S rRNA (cytosine(1402)-N(4))-methyltransferase RsmH [Gammaproteobacteria bacterium]|nr:16S rRNA (cytosine(1402)-N(4))-methyltransferase RsmH [Gammaproteobacteria bacterium]